MSYRDVPRALLFVTISTSKRLFALDAASGAVVWRYEDEELRGQPGYLVAAADRLYLAGGVRLFCLDTETGALLWKCESPVRAGAPVVVEGDRIFLAGVGEVACFSTTGRLLWHQPFEAQGNGHVAIAIGGESPARA